VIVVVVLKPAESQNDLLWSDSRHHEDQARSLFVLGSILAATVDAPLCMRRVTREPALDLANARNVLTFTAENMNCRLFV